MQKLFIEQLPSLAGKKVLMRVDFNVPLDADGAVTDATRIEATLPSIRYVLNQGGSLILMSHLGRPKGAVMPEFSLKPCAHVLAGLLDLPVKMAPNTIGHEVRQMAADLKPKEILMLENVRFHRAEEHPEEDPEFAKQLAALGEFFVNDAFGAAHRKHSSTYTITHYFPGRAAAGFLLEKEIRFLGEALSEPQRPFYAIIGGAKIASKIGVLKALLKQVDGLLIGGGMAYTFLKAQGRAVGKSLCDHTLVSVAKEMIEECATRKIDLQLPLDVVAAETCSENAPTQIFAIDKGIPDTWEGFDIGPQTQALFSQKISTAKTVLWNGPVGVFELEPFAAGTKAVALALGETNAVTIVGGGDSIAAINAAEVSDRITHLSTGGGATLEYIEHGTLPAIEALSDHFSQTAIS